MVALGFHKKRVVSGCMYFHFGKNAIYKYGASDRRFQNLRANNLVMWEALRWYQKRGFQSLSLGRSEPTNQGLLQFKRGWSCREEFLQYRRFDLSRNEFIEARIGTGERMTRILKNAPIPVLRLIGAAVYRHVG
jgi:lipid II:glycine glycyltransferase (peptidoglycan interpeptide bridge formation enzyme)